MPETTNVPPVTQSTESNSPGSGSGSAQESSAQQQSADGKGSGNREQIVKDLVAHGSKKFNIRDQREAAKSAEGKGTKTATSAADRTGSTDTNSSQKTPGSSDGSADPANTSKDKSNTTNGEKKVDSSGDGDPVLAKRIAALATAEQNARVASEKLKTERESFDKDRASYKELTETVKAFTSTFEKDPLEALKLLGLADEHVNGLYWKLNDRYLKGKSEVLSPEDIDKRIEARAKEIALQQYKELQESSQTQSQKQFETAMEAAKAQYLTRTFETFQANKAKYPAIVALGVPAGDIHSYVQDTYKATNKMPTFDETLAHFEGTLSKKIEASGYTRQQKVEAPTAKDKPSPGKTVTADWQSRSVPQDGTDDKPKTRRESANEIKRKLDQGFYKRKNA